MVSLSNAIDVSSPLPVLGALIGVMAVTRGPLSGPDAVDNHQGAPRSLWVTLTAPVSLLKSCLCGHVDVGRCNYSDLAGRSLRCLVCALARPPTSIRASIADSAVRSRLRCVKGCAAMAAPLHVPAIARTPHGADRPTTVAVLVAVRAARRRHNNPAALGFD
jgi:hypothetical protein